MSQLYDDLKEVMPPDMEVPRALKLLYNWIDAQGLDEGGFGTLYSDEAVWESWNDAGRIGGTDIEFSAFDNDNLHQWFGHDDPDILERVCVFARTGADGSMAAFWIDDDDRQVIVHLGSGSGSTLCCVLAEDAIDFLRLIAIGYDEICWGKKFAKPPNADAEFIVHPNADYQQWVRQTFNVTIPETALEIVKHPADLGDIDSPDRFARWCASEARRSR
jgi:hypothetical protein